MEIVFFRQVDRKSQKNRDDSAIRMKRYLISDMTTSNRDVVAEFQYNSHWKIYRLLLKGSAWTPDLIKAIKKSCVEHIPHPLDLLQNQYQVVDIPQISI